MNNQNRMNALMVCLQFLAAVVLLAIGFYTVPEMKCKSIAVAMQRPYVFQPLNGCWVQTLQGNWQRVDQPTASNYQP